MRFVLPDSEIAVRLVPAAALGSFIGFERERLLWAAGIRTHMVVCVGACLVMIVSAYGFHGVLDGHVILDPSRVAAQVVSVIALNERAVSAAPRRLDRGDVDLLHAHHRIKRALCFIAAGRQRLGQHARRDLPGDAPLVFAPAALRSPGRHCRRWRSSSGRSLADRRWRSGTRRLRYA